ncbi:hypothetical protein PENANT_c253G07126 [Penicillium antarcticum]|uniref:Uncharacterized protein n=1 Tax=Penicillium antarcticum TaxID=416450 RepID=A0A1V6P157_9EURO|nr:hypothetical protein PENANT_c253G07126 [Penicillium antarcticum]
MTMVSRMKHS